MRTSGNGFKRRDAVSSACFLSIFQATKNTHTAHHHTIIQLPKIMSLSTGGYTLRNWTFIISDQLQEDILLWSADERILSLKLDFSSSVSWLWPYPPKSVETTRRKVSVTVCRIVSSFYMYHSLYSEVNMGW